MTDKYITKKEVEYWLDDNYQNWIADNLVGLINSDDPNEIPNLRKEIKQASFDSQDAQ